MLCFCLSCAAQDSPQAVMQRAIDAQQAGRFEAAVRDYRLLLKQYPGIFEVRANVSATLAGEDLYTESIAEYQRALALRSDPKVRLNLALAYYKTGDLRLAIAKKRHQYQYGTSMIRNGRGLVFLATVIVTRWCTTPGRRWRAE